MPVEHLSCALCCLLDADCALFGIKLLYTVHRKYSIKVLLDRERKTSLFTAVHTILVCGAGVKLFLHLLITSGNRTPGSRSYSDLLDALADSVCIHQLVLKQRSKQLGCLYNCRCLT